MSKDIFQQLGYLAHPYTAEAPEAQLLNTARCRYLYALLLRQGYRVVCPVLESAGLDGLFFANSSLDHKKWLDLDIEVMRRLDYLMLPPDWDKSRGCQMEFEWARKQRMPVYYAHMSYQGWPPSIMDPGPQVKVERIYNPEEDCADA